MSTLDFTVKYIEFSSLIAMIWVVIDYLGLIKDSKDEWKNIGSSVRIVLMIYITLSYFLSALFFGWLFIITDTLKVFEILMRKFGTIKKIK